MSSSLLIFHSTPRHVCVIGSDIKRVYQFRDDLIPKWIHKSGFYVTCNGRLIHDEDEVENGEVYHCVPTLVGGKGGFGSMLRAIGAQIEKTTSREACRDLSGRRMRDVNNEKKLKEWLAKQADREREKEERRQERIARRRTQGQHNFDDPTYTEQRSKVADDLEDALKTGLQRDGPSSTVTRADFRGKRKADSKGPVKSKRSREWLGLDLDELSSGDSDEDSRSSNEHGSDPKTSSQVSENSQDGVCCTSQMDGTLPSSTEPSTSGTGSLDIGKAESNTLKSCSERLSSQSDISGQRETTQTDTKISSEGQDSSSNNEQVVVKLESNVSMSCSGQGETTQPVETKCSLLASLPPPTNIKGEKETSIETKLENVDLSEFSSASELESLGLERLKFALTQRGLKCGGTLQQRAERLFSVKGLTRDQIDPSLFPKGQNGKGNK